MKLGIFPLFRPESFRDGNFTATGLEYFSANALGEIIGFVQAHFPDINIVMRLALNEILRLKPDLVLLWATSPSFGQAQPVAESIKTYLGVPVWIAGPHISYVPQSLPTDVDLGIIGEVELPLQQLLTLFLKHGDQGNLHYRRVPGIIYQSRGKVYSGSPAQVMPNLSQLPQPNYRMFLDLPGFSAPVVRSARVSDNLLTALAYPPSRKARLLMPEHLCQQVEQISDNYRYLYQGFPFPAEQLHYLSPVFIPDYMFLQHRQRLDAFIALYKQKGLDKKVFLIPNLLPELASDELFSLLKSINTRKVMLLLGPFGHQHPLLPQCSPEQLIEVLKLCKKYHLGVIATLFLNPDPATSRQQLAQTFWALKDDIQAFERLHVSVLGAFPGLPMWEPFVSKHRLDSRAFAEFPWASLDWEVFSPNLPLMPAQLDRNLLDEIYRAFKALSLLQDQVSQPLMEDLFIKVRDEQVKAFAKKMLHPDDRVLELPLLDELAIQTLLPEYQISQIKIKNGAIEGPLPLEKFDFILLSGSLPGLREPEVCLKQLVSNCLKPDGRLLIYWMNPLNLKTLVNFLKWPAKHSSFTDPVLHYIRGDEMNALLNRCGLEVVHTDYTIMDEVEQARPTVETLAARLEFQASLKIPQHMLYVSEIKILAKNRP